MNYCRWSVETTLQLAWTYKLELETPCELSIPHVTSLASLCTNVCCCVPTVLGPNLRLFLPCNPCSVIQGSFLPLSPSLPRLLFFLFNCMKLVYLSFTGKGFKSLQSLFRFNFVTTSVAFKVINRRIFWVEAILKII